MGTIRKFVKNNSVASWTSKALITAGFLIALIGCGSGGSSTQLSPPPAPQQYVYAANYNSNDVSAYVINSSTGALTPIPGSPFNTAGGQANQGQTGSVAVDPSGKFVYVSSTQPSPEISAYAINASTGALTPIPGSPFAAGAGPGQLAIDPSGKFLFEANEYSTASGSGGVFVFTINSSTGALTTVAGSPFAAESLIGFAVHPSGKFLYAVDFYTPTVEAFTIDQTTGVLTSIPGSPFPAGNSPYKMTVDPSGKFAYITDQVGGTILAFTIDSATGALTAVSGSPFGADGSFGITVDPSDKYLYVGFGSGVEGFSIDAATGALTPLASLFPAGVNAVGIAVDPSDKFVYVTNLTSNNISAYTFDATSGALTPISGSPYAAGNGPVSVVVTPKIQ